MALRGVGISLWRTRPGGVTGLVEDLETLRSAGPDFVEVFPDQLGVMLGGRLDPVRLGPIREALLKAALAYTVHAPLDMNLMDLTAHGLHRDVLNASMEFASGIGAEVIVCHAGQRTAHALHS